MSTVRLIPTRPLPEQKTLPGALEQPFSRFLRPPYWENLVQSFLNLLGDLEGKTLVIAADSRRESQILLETLLAIAAAHPFARLMLVSGIPYPPLVSQLVLKYQAIGALTLQTLPQAGEPDCQVKLYWQSGQVFSPPLLEALGERTQVIQSYRWHPWVLDLAVDRRYSLEGLDIETLEGVQVYGREMARLFDFDLIQSVFQRRDLRVQCLDSESYAYAQALLEGELGLPQNTAQSPLQTALPAPGAIFLSRRRCRLWGQRGEINPGDLLALLVSQAAVSPVYRSRFSGVARSRFASAAADHACAKLHLPCYPAPGPWSYLSETFESLRITLAGNERGELGGDHSREPDGLWVLLFLLNLEAALNQSWEVLLAKQWRELGRNYHAGYQVPRRRGYSLDPILEAIKQESERGQLYGAYEVAYGQELSYYDRELGRTLTPVGYEWGFTDGARLLVYEALDFIYLYLERYEPHPPAQSLTPPEALAPLLALTQSLLALPAPFCFNP
ncbi:MAG: hypothetical protein ACK5CA_03590 [Cyanobacteriota bacterium]|jgi:phosphoglucomutase